MRPSNFIQDIIILGAGIAGLSAAVHLSRAGFSVMVIENRDAGPEKYRPGERLPPSAYLELDQLGIERRAVSRPGTGVISFWDTEKPIRLPLPPTAKRSLDINRQALEIALKDAAMRAGASFRCGLHFDSVSGEPGDWTMSCLGPSGPVALRSRFLIDASGRRAILARARGAQIEDHGNLIALVCQCKNEGQLSDFTIEATSTGWWYGTPMSDGEIVSTFLCPRSQLTKNLSHDYETAARMTRLFQWSAAIGTKPQLFAAQPGGIIGSPCGPGWAAIGDAALHTDPIEGKGMLRAMISARHLCTLLTSTPEHVAQRRQDWSDYLAGQLRNHLNLRTASYDAAHCMRDDIREAILGRICLEA